MTLVFFFPIPIRADRRELFQLERLESEGYNIVILNATKYYDKVNLARHPEIYHRTVDCATMEDFINFGKTLPDEPVLFITSDLYVNKVSPIFKLLIRKNDKLLAYKTKEVLDLNYLDNIPKLLLKKLIRGLDKYFNLNFFSFYYKWKYGVIIPDYYLFSTKYTIPVKVYLTVKKDNRILVHSDDINQILNSGPSVIESEKKIGVFLDQAIPFLELTHPGLPKGFIPNGYLDTYYDNVEKSLKQLQNLLGLDEIVIALHPNSVFFKNELEGKLIGFRSFVWKTTELIRDGSIIIGHFSTALGFAVYFKKPVILLKDQFLMNEKDMKQGILYFINHLDMKSVNMDMVIENIKESDLIINKEKYLKYTKEFLKDNDIQENSYYYAIKKITDDLINRKSSKI